MQKSQWCGEVVFTSASNQNGASFNYCYESFWLSDSMYLQMNDWKYDMWMWRKNVCVNA